MQQEQRSAPPSKLVMHPCPIDIDVSIFDFAAGSLPPVGFG